jgi:hypothetical protein
MVALPVDWEPVRLAGLRRQRSGDRGRPQNGSSRSARTESRSTRLLPSVSSSLGPPSPMGYLD